MSRTAKKSNWTKAIADTFTRSDCGALGNLLYSKDIASKDIEDLAYIYLERWKKRGGASAFPTSYLLRPEDALTKLVDSKRLRRVCLGTIAKECYIFQNDRMHVRYPLFRNILRQRTCPKDLINLSIDKCGNTEVFEAILENRAITKDQYDKIFELCKKGVARHGDFYREVVTRLFDYKYAPTDIVEQFATIVNYSIPELKDLKLLTRVLQSPKTPESFLLKYLKSNSGLDNDWSTWFCILAIYNNPACTEQLFQEIEKQIGSASCSFTAYIKSHWKECKAFRIHPRCSATLQPLLFSADLEVRKVAKRIIDCET